MTAYADLADLPEDDRIAAIVRTARAKPGQIIGVAVDDEPGKVERYKTKLRMAGLQILGDAAGPVKGAWFIQVTAKVH